MALLNIILGVIVGGLVLAVGGYLFFVQWPRALARIEALSNLAPQLRAQFSKDGDKAFKKALREFWSFGRGTRFSMYNQLTQFPDHPGLALFDAVVVEEYGDSIERDDHTVACLEVGHLNIPQFTLRQRADLKKHFRQPKNQVALTQYGAFSAAYVLISPDAEAMERIFTPALVAWFEQHPETCVECDGRYIVWYQRDTLVPVEQYPDFIRKATEELRRFISPGMLSAMVSG